MTNKVILFSCAILLCLLSPACVKRLPNNVEAELNSKQHDPSSFSARDYVYDYKQVALGTAYREVHVICSECPLPTKLKRELRDTPLALYWGKEKAVSNAKSSGPAVDQSVPALLGAHSEQEKPGRGTVNTGQSASKTTIEASERIMNHHAAPGCVTPPIRFDFDSAVLKDNETSKILASLDRMKRAGAVIVKGYTCNIGSKEYNDRLALRRAQAVAAYLEKHGVKPSEVTGEGKCCYVSDDCDENRRVEFECLEPKGE